VGEVATIAAKLKPLLLMLSSDRPGEVANAAAAVTRTLKAANLDWHDLVGALTKPAASKSPPHDDDFNDADTDDDIDASDWRAMRDFCLKHDACLREREREFIDSLAYWRGQPTEKQLSWLLAIEHRIRKNRKPKHEEASPLPRQRRTARIAATGPRKGLLRWLMNLPNKTSTLRPKPISTLHMDRNSCRRPMSAPARSALKF